MSQEIRKVKATKFILPVLLVVALVTAIGYFSAQIGGQKIAVQQSITSWISAQQENAKKHGYILDIKYADLKFEGGLQDGYLLVNKPQISIVPYFAGISRKQLMKSASILRSNRLIIYPMNSELSSLRIELPDAIKTYQAQIKQPTVILKANTPPMLQITSQKSGKNKLVDIAHNLPNKWQLKLHVFKDDSAKKYGYDQYNLTMTEGAKAEIGLDLTDFRVHSWQLQAKDIAVQQGSGKALATIFSVAKIDAISSKKPAKNGFDHFSSDVTIKDVAGVGLGKFAPINLDWHFNYSGDMQQPDGSELRLRNFTIAIPDASLNIAAQFEMIAGEAMPVGHANVTFGNLPYIRKLLLENDLFTAGDQKKLDKVLPLIAGKKDSGDDVTVNFKRKVGRDFNIGKISADEFMKLWFQNPVNK